MFIILKKELQAFFKDKRALMLGILMPIILISVFSLAFGGLGGKGQNKKISLLVCDEDKTDLSKQIIGSLESIKTLDISTTTTDSALTLVKGGHYPAALILHKGFNDSLKTIKHLPWELKYDITRSIEMGMVEQSLLQNLYGKVSKMMNEKMILNNPAMQFPGMENMIAVQMKNFESNSKEINKLMQLKDSPLEKVPDNQGVVQALAGTAVMMLLFSLTAMGARLIEEKENGTLKRLLSSPLKTTDILAGKMLSSMTFAICQLFIMLVFSSIAFGIVLLPNLLPVTILVIAIAFACSGFGMFIASIIKTREQAQGVSTLATLIMSAIGGSMVPLFLMPQWMQMVGHVSINYWAIQGFYDIFWRQLPITDSLFLGRIVVLICIGSALTFFSFFLFRKNATSMA
ncbi:MAG TPA: ABC transporter permease [Bacteroidia bacterium]|nr:ABC transporter permease [Bacteroidia bacterium]